MSALRFRVSLNSRTSLGKGWWDGGKDALRNKFIILRCSIIGVIIGFLPGLGGSLVDWIAYGHVIQTTREREPFGKGDIRYLASFRILIITLTSYQATRSWRDLIALIVMGVLGWLMKQYGWPRTATLIGYV